MPGRKEGERGRATLPLQCVCEQARWPLLLCASLLRASAKRPRLVFGRFQRRRNVRVLVVLLIAPAFAAAQALELKGLTLGMKQADVVERAARGPCPVPDPPKAIDECVYLGTGANVTEFDTIAGEFVHKWQFGFADGKLGEVIVTFPHYSFREVRAALRSKYGIPRSTSRDTFRNRMGATFIGDRDAWGAGRDVLSAREYFGDVNTSAVVLSAGWFYEKHKAWRDRETKGKAKDL